MEKKKNSYTLTRTFSGRLEVVTIRLQVPGIFYSFSGRMKPSWKYVAFYLTSFIRQLITKCVKQLSAWDEWAEPGIGDLLLSEAYCHTFQDSNTMVKVGLTIVVSPTLESRTIPDLFSCRQSPDDSLLLKKKKRERENGSGYCKGRVWLDNFFSNFNLLAQRALQSQSVGSAIRDQWKPTQQRHLSFRRKRTPLWRPRFCPSINMWVKLTFGIPASAPAHVGIH